MLNHYTIEKAICQGIFKKIQGDYFCFLGDITALFSVMIRHMLTNADNSSVISSTIYTPAAAFRISSPEIPILSRETPNTFAVRASSSSISISGPKNSAAAPTGIVITANITAKKGSIFSRLSTLTVFILCFSDIRQAASFANKIVDASMITITAAKNLTSLFLNLPMPETSYPSRKSTA